MPARLPTQSSGRPLEKREREQRVPARTRALRVRLAVLVIAVAFPAIVLLAFLSLYSAEKELALELENRGVSTAHWLDAWFGATDTRDRAEVQREVDRLTSTRGSGIDEIQVFVKDQDGDLDCIASRSGAVRIPAAPKDRRAAADDRISLDTLYRAEGERYWDISAPLHRGGAGHDVKGVLHLELSLRDADALIGEARRNLLLATLGALGLTAFALFLALDRAIGRPVEALVAAMERARQGDLTATVEVRTLDELGWVGENFNRMLRRLKENDEELARWNTELKSQIAAATAELAHKNAELEQANHRLFDAQRALGNAERLASLGQLASNIAHEIGTPLNSIYGHIQLLASEDGLSEAARSRIGVVESQVERLTAIIQNVLKTLRLPEAELREVAVNPIVEGIAAFTRPVADRAGIKLALELAPSLPFVYVDSGQLEQVIMNLFTNALDAMPAGGTLTLATTSGKGADGGDVVLLKIKDTGVGIPPELQHRIFEPFFSTKAKGRGTGLGLPICQQILHTFRGSISIESEVQKGSTFTVTLPAVQKGDAEKRGESGDSSKNSAISDSAPLTTSSSSDLTTSSDESVATAGLGRRNDDAATAERAP